MLSQSTISNCHPDSNQKAIKFCSNVICIFVAFLSSTKMIIRKTVKVKLANKPILLLVNKYWKNYWTNIKTNTVAGQKYWNWASDQYCYLWWKRKVRVPKLYWGWKAFSVWPWNANVWITNTHIWQHRIFLCDNRKVTLHPNIIFVFLQKRCSFPSTRFTF